MQGAWLVVAHSTVSPRFSSRASKFTRALTVSANMFLNKTGIIFPVNHPFHVGKHIPGYGHSVINRFTHIG